MSRTLTLAFAVLIAAGCSGKPSPADAGPGSVGVATGGGGSFTSGGASGTSGTSSSTRSTGSSGTSGSSGTGGSTGSSPGSMSGPLAFPVNSAFMATNHDADGGEKLTGVYITLVDQSMSCSDIAAVYQTGQVGSPLKLFSCDVTNLAGQALAPGTYPISNQAIFVADGGSGQPDGNYGYGELNLTAQSGGGPNYPAQWGTVTFSRVSMGSAAGSFDITFGYPDGGGLNELTGTFDAPYCDSL